MAQEAAMQDAAVQEAVTRSSAPRSPAGRSGRTYPGAGFPSGAFPGRAFGGWISSVCRHLSLFRLRAWHASDGHGHVCRLDPMLHQPDAISGICFALRSKVELCM